MILFTQLETVGCLLEFIPTEEHMISLSLMLGVTLCLPSLPGSNWWKCIDGSPS